MLVGISNHLRFIYLIDVGMDVLFIKFNLKYRYQRMRHMTPSQTQSWHLLPKWTGNQRAENLMWLRQKSKFMSTWHGEYQALPSSWTLKPSSLRLLNLVKICSREHPKSPKVKVKIVDPEVGENAFYLQMTCTNIVSVYD